jgi:hypothetical protein
VNRGWSGEEIYCHSRTCRSKRSLPRRILLLHPNLEATHRSTMVQAFTTTTLFPATSKLRSRIVDSGLWLVRRGNLLPQSSNMYKSRLTQCTLQSLQILVLLAPLSFSHMFGRFRVNLPQPEPPRHTSPLRQQGPQHCVVPPPAVWMSNPEEKHTNPGNFARYADYSGPNRRDMIATLRSEARMVSTTSGSRSSQLQRCLLRMVFDMITPWPDGIWIAFLAVASERCVRVYLYH